MQIKPKKFVLITGATSGIGLELSRQFAKNGYPLILVARDKDKLIEVSTEFIKTYKVQIEIFQFDLSDLSNVDQLFMACESKNYEIGILINNAGCGLYGGFVDLIWSDQLKMMNLNMQSLTKLTYLFSKRMKERNYGKILNVASVAGFFPSPNMAVYHATKAFVLSFSRALTIELKPYKISVSTLCPGYTATSFQKNAGLIGFRLLNLTILTPKRVAKIAFKGLMKCQPIIIVGWINKLFVILGSILPKNLQGYISEKLYFKF